MFNANDILNQPLPQYLNLKPVNNKTILKIVSKDLNQLVNKSTENTSGAIIVSDENKPDNSKLENTKLYNSKLVNSVKKQQDFLTFLDVKNKMNEQFGLNEGQLSTTLDIIAVYLKGQKILYLKGKEYCEFYLYRLMLPTILISSSCSVISGIYKDSSHASEAVSILTAFNAFILSVITYLKLDAQAEAHKTSAYSFDQLQSLCEFTSGKILLSNHDDNVNSSTAIDINKDRKENNLDNTENNTDNVSILETLKKGVIRYDLAYVQNFIDQIETKVKEIKEKNQFILPKSIIKRYQTIYNMNVFTKVKEIQTQEMILLNRLKIYTNKMIEVQNKIFAGDNTAETSAEFDKKHDYKNVMLEEVINFRQQYNDISTNMMNEIKIKKRRTCCFCFWM